MFSYPSDVISGVPQGSVLGPLLFLLYTQDTSSVLSYSSVLYFADDTKLKIPIKSQEDCENLQSDLYSVYQWADRNKMVLNGEKFKLLRYSATGNSQDYDYIDSQGSQIVACNNAVDLGIIMSDNGKFHDHINNIISKANHRQRWILRVFRTREPAPTMTLFKALVLPIVEYCCQLWHPMEAGMTQRIEAIQRSFTARISVISHMNYWDRLKYLNVYSLERRRERYSILYVWKILSGLCPNIEGSDSIVPYHNIRQGRLCHVPGLVRYARTGMLTTREGTFAITGPRLFNSIPKELRDYHGSLNGFKRLLDIFLSDIPDEPPIPGYYRPGSSNGIIEQLRVLRARR